VDKLCAEKNPL